MNSTRVRVVEIDDGARRPVAERTVGDGKMSVRRTVNLQGFRIPLRTELAEGDLQEALDELQGRLEALRAGTAVKDPARLALMAALNLAGELVLQRRGAAQPEAGGQLDILSERIEERLASTREEIDRREADRS